MEMVAEDDREPGKWSYDPATKMLTMSDVEVSDVWQCEIVKLNETEMVLRSIEDDELTVAHFKPATN
jgi:hypothetical protein